MTTSPGREGAVLGIVCAAALGSVGCNDMCWGTEFPSLTMSAAFQPTSGEPPAPSTSMLSGTPISTGGWDATISNAATAPDFTGFVVFTWPSGAHLTLALPFPMTKNADLPVTTDPTISAVNTFSGSRPARSDVGILHAFGCTADLEACRAAREQVWQGTVRVEGTAPLRLRLDATATYGDGTARGPDSFQGPIVFRLEHGTVCRD